MLTTFRPSQMPPSGGRFRPAIPLLSPARKGALSGERWIRHQRRRKAIVTALWCLAVSIAAIAIALLMPAA